MIRQGARLLLGSALVLGGAAFLAPEASAQASRTWVSGVGDDANPCSRTAPCKTFAGSISKTAANGTINCLDPGGFGAVTITKSIKIDCHETIGSVLASGTNGININTTSTTDVVKLIGLDIEGFGNGIKGISVTQVGALEVYDTVIQNFQLSAATGISFTPNNSGAKLTVVNTKISNNGTGVLVQPGASATGVTGTIEGTTIVDNSGVGVTVYGSGTSAADPGSRVTIKSSNVSNNGAGLLALSPSGSFKVQATEINSMFNYNSSFGIAANGTYAQAWISGNTVTGNVEGLKVGPTGTVLSFGDNVVFGNGASVTPTAAPAKQ